MLKKKYQQQKDIMEDLVLISKLKKLIDNNKCDEDGWLYLENRFTN